MIKKYKYRWYEERNVYKSSYDIYINDSFKIILFIDKLESQNLGFE